MNRPRTGQRPFVIVTSEGRLQRTEGRRFAAQALTDAMKRGESPRFAWLYHVPVFETVADAASVLVPGFESIQWNRFDFVAVYSDVEIPLDLRETVARTSTTEDFSDFIEWRTLPVPTAVAAPGGKGEDRCG